MEEPDWRAADPWRSLCKIKRRDSLGWPHQSYDDEPHTGKRTKMVLNELERVASLDDADLLQLYRKVWRSLVHNQRLFLTKNHKDKYEKIFQNM